MDKELLQRYVEGNVSEEEAEIVVDWLDQDEANIKEFMALHKLYDISLFNRPEIESGFVRPLKKTEKRFRTVVFELLKIAATFLLFISVAHFLKERPEEKNDETAYQTLFIPAGQRAELTLPDSTKVWLNAKTRLIYPVSFGDGERTVTLDGEAYFEVKQNKKQPFIVKTKTMNVNVLGTEFNIMAYSELNTTEIALLKGAVDLKPSGSASFKKYAMKVNEQFTLNNNETEIIQINDYDYFKWKDGLLCFTNETVETIIGKLQLYFDIKIVVENKPLLKHMYTGKFRSKDGVEQVLKVLQLEHKFTYTRDHEYNVITIK